METYFGFFDNLKPDPLVDDLGAREQMNLDGMHIQSTPTVCLPQDYVEWIHYGKKYEMNPENFMGTNYDDVA